MATTATFTQRQIEPGEQKTRVQIELSPTETERMNWLMRVCDIRGRRDLFNNALTLFEWAVRETTEGRKIASFDDRTKERNILSMPALSAAEAHGLQYTDAREHNRTR